MKLENVEDEVIQVKSPCLVAGIGTGKFVANLELVHGVGMKQAIFYKIFAR